MHSSPMPLQTMYQTSAWKQKKHQLKLTKKPSYFLLQFLLQFQAIDVLLCTLIYCRNINFLTKMPRLIKALEVSAAATTTLHSEMQVHYQDLVIIMNRNFNTSFTTNLGEAQRLKMV